MSTQPCCRLEELERIERGFDKKIEFKKNDSIFNSVCCFYDFSFSLCHIRLLQAEILACLVELLGGSQMTCNGCHLVAAVDCTLIRNLPRAQDHVVVLEVTVAVCRDLAGLDIQLTRRQILNPVNLEPSWCLESCPVDADVECRVAG